MARNSSMRRSVSILAALSLMIGTAVVMAAPTAGACGRQATRQEVFRAMRAGDLRAGDLPFRGGVETATLRTFHLEVEQPKKTWKIGETAAFDVTVTRPANEDPLGEGEPMPWTERPYVEPAAGAIVGIGLHIGRVFLPGAAITDENGLAKVRIKIENYAPAGKVVDASVYAWKIFQETQCLTIQEDGYKILPRAGKTTR